MNNRNDFLEPVQIEYLGDPIRVERSLVDEILKQDIYNQETITDPNGTYRQIETIVVEPSTLLTTGDNKVTITVPFDASLVSVHAFVSTPSTSGAVSVVITNQNDQGIGYLNIAANKNGSDESGGLESVNASSQEVRRYEFLKINVDSIGTDSAGLVVQLYFVVSKFYYS